MRVNADFEPYIAGSSHDDREEDFCQREDSTVPLTLNPDTAETRRVA